MKKEEAAKTIKALENCQKEKCNDIRESKELVKHRKKVADIKAKIEALQSEYKSGKLSASKFLSKIETYGDKLRELASQVLSTKSSEKMIECELRHCASETNSLITALKKDVDSMCKTGDKKACKVVDASKELTVKSVQDLLKFVSS